MLSIGYLHFDPAQRFTIGSSAPRLFKSQNLSLKSHRLLTVPDEEAQVIDPGCDACVGLELARRFCFHPIRKALNELDQHAIRILDLGGIVTGAGLTHITWLDVEAFRP